MADDGWTRPGRPAYPAWLHSREPDPDPAPAGSLALWVEQMLLKLAIVGLVALVLVQTLLAIPQLRRLMVQVERLEGRLSVALGGGAAPPSAERPGASGAPRAPGAPGRSGAAGGAGAPGTSGTPEGPAPRTAAGRPEAGGGEPTVAAAAPAGTRHLSIALITRPSAPARLLVDRVPVAEFSRGQVTVAVAPGQQLAIAAGEAGTALTFRVVQADGLRYPPLGAEWTVAGGTVQIGTVR